MLAKHREEGSLWQDNTHTRRAAEEKNIDEYADALATLSPCKIYTMPAQAFYFLVSC